MSRIVARDLPVTRPCWSGSILRAVLVFLLVLPVLVLAVTSWPEDPDEFWNSWRVFDRIALERLATSFHLASWITFFALGFGLTAYAGHCSVSPSVRPLLGVLALLPLSYPPFGAASAWMTLVTRLENPGQGRILWETHGALSRVLYSVIGGGWILGLCLWPIVYLLLSLAAGPRQASMEAARLSMTRWMAFRTVMWPAWRLPFFTAGAVVFCLGLLQFEVPSLLQIQVYPLEIFIQFTARFSDWNACLLCLPYLLAAAPMAWAMGRIPGHLELQGGEPAYRWTAKSLRAAAPVGTAVVLTLSILVPVWGLMSHAGSPSLTLRVMLEHAPIVFRSLFYAGTAAAAVVVLGTWYTSDTSPKRFSITPVLLLVLFVIPGALTGSGWLRIRSYWPGVQPPAVMTASLLAAYLSHTFLLGYGAGILLWRYYGIRQREFDTLLDLGYFTRMRRLLLPALWRPGWLATLLVTLVLWGDVGMTILLYPPGGDTLAVEYYNLLHYGSESRTAAIGLLLLLVPALALLAVFIVTSRAASRT